MATPPRPHVSAVCDLATGDLWIREHGTRETTCIRQGGRLEPAEIVAVPELYALPNHIREAACVFVARRWHNVWDTR